MVNIVWVWSGFQSQSFSIHFWVALVLNMWQQQAEKLKQNLTALEKVPPNKVSFLSVLLNLQEYNVQKA